MISIAGLHELHANAVARSRFLASLGQCYPRYSINEQHASPYYRSCCLVSRHSVSYMLAYHIIQYIEGITEQECSAVWSDGGVTNLGFLQVALFQDLFDTLLLDVCAELVLQRTLGGAV
jgi:hypothetical protein